MFNHFRFEMTVPSAFLIAWIILQPESLVTAQIPEPKLDYQQQHNELKEYATLKAEQAYAVYLSTQFPADGLSESEKIARDKTARDMYNNVYQTVIAEYARIPEPAKILEHELDRRAKAIFSEAFTVMGIKDSSRLVDTIRYNPALDSGSEGKFTYDPATNKRIIELGPKAFREYCRTGRLLAAAHEIQHAIDFDARVAHTALQLHRSSLDRGGALSIEDATTLARIKVHEKYTAMYSLAYFCNEVRAETRAFEVIEKYLDGKICNTLRDAHRRYVAHFSTLIQTDIERRKNRRDALAQSSFRDKMEDKWKQTSKTGFGQFPEDDGGGSYRSIARSSNFNAATTGRPYFGGVILGNASDAPGLRLISAQIVHHDGKPRIELTMDVNGKRVRCDYEPSSADELAAAYRIVHPEPEIAEEFLLDGTECELVHCGLDETGLFARFAIHPAMAGTALGRSAYELDCLVLRRTPGLFESVDPKLYPMQWYDEKSVLRVDGERLVVESARGPKNVLLRARFWGPSPEVYRPDAPGPAMLKFSPQYIAEAQRGFHDQLLFSEEAIRSGGQPLTLAEVRREAEEYDRAARDRHSSDLPLDSGREIAAVYDRFPAIRSIDQFARTLAVLRWIGDHEEVAFPALPSGIQSVPAETPHLMSLGEISRLSTESNPKLEEVPARVASPDVSERWYAAYRGDARDGWLRVSEFNVLDRPGGTRHFVWETERVIGPLSRMTTIHRRDSRYTGKVDAFRMQGRMALDDGNEETIAFSGVRRRDEMVYRTYKGGAIVQEDITPWEGRVAVPDILDKVFEHQPVKPGGTPLKFNTLDLTYGGFLCDVEIVPRTYETTDVLGTSRNLLRVDVDFWNDQSATPSQPQARRRIAHETKWIDERGVIVKFESSKVECVLPIQPPADPVNDKAWPADSPPFSSSHPDFGGLEARLDFDANVRRNSWVREELVSRRGFQFLPDSTAPTTFHLSTRKQALADDLYQRTKNQFQRFPADVTVFQPQTPLGPSDLFSEIKLRVTFRTPVRFPPFSSISRQTVKRIDDRIWEVALRDTADGAVDGTGPESLLLLCRHSTPAVESDDPAIIAFTRSIPTFPEPIDTVRGAARIIHDWIGKSYQYAFATAAQTLANREGDCKGHAFLLAAVLRARGIPARIVTGFRYVTESNTFVGHAWTEAWIEGRWLAFDASNPTGEINSGYLQTCELPDMLLPLKADASIESAIGLDGIERVEVLEQVFRSSQKRVKSDGPPEAIVNESSLTPLLPPFHDERTAFLLGLNLLRRSYLSDLYGPNHVSTASLKRQCDVWATQLDVTIPESYVPTLESEVAWINGARFVLHRVRLYLAAQLQGRHGSRIAALFQTGLHASVASELDILLPPERREGHLRLFSESAEAANLDPKGAQEFANAIRELYGSKVSEAPLVTRALGEMLASTQRRVEQASRLQDDYVSRVIAEIDPQPGIPDVPRDADDASGEPGRKP